MAEEIMNVQAIGRSILFIAIFTVLVFLIGKLGAFRLTRFLVARGTTELVTMAALGLIFLVGLLAYKFNFSWALGGFLARRFCLDRNWRKIEQLTEPLRDLFSAVFFVTVGMLIDPVAQVRSDNHPSFNGYHNWKILFLLAWVLPCRPRSLRGDEGRSNKVPDRGIQFRYSLNRSDSWSHELRTAIDCFGCRFHNDTHHYADTE